MARVLGYGGLANTNGARDFSGKEEAEVLPAFVSRTTIGIGIGVPYVLGFVMLRLL